MEAQHNSPYAALEKLSKWNFPAWVHNWQAPEWLNARPDASKASGIAANREMWKWIVAAAGAGALGRSGIGLLRMMQPRSDYDPSPSSQPVSMVIPQDEDEEEKFGMDKESFENPLPKLIKMFQKATMPAFDAENAFTGAGSNSKYTVPALWALGLPAAVGAGYGGWKAIDAIADSRRKSERDTELENAKAEYQRLLQATLVKRNADEEGIEAELDELAEMVAESSEKQAAVSDWRNAGMGAMGAYAILAALASGTLSYNHFKSRNQRVIAEEALRRRAKERSGGVSPIYLQAAPAEGE